MNGIDATTAILMAWSAALSVFTILISIIGNGYRDQFSELKKKVEADSLELGRINVLVAGEYVTRDEFREEIRTILTSIRDLGVGIYAKFDGYERRLNSEFDRRNKPE